MGIIFNKKSLLNPDLKSQGRSIRSKVESKACHTSSSNLNFLDNSITLVWASMSKHFIMAVGSGLRTKIRPMLNNRGQHIA